MSCIDRNELIQSMFYMMHSGIKITDMSIFRVFDELLPENVFDKWLIVTNNEQAFLDWLNDSQLKFYYKPCMIDSIEEVESLDSIINELSTRIYNALVNNGINPHTPLRIAFNGTTLYDLVKIRNLGEGSIKVLIEVLENHGFAYKSDFENIVINDLKNIKDREFRSVKGISKHGFSELDGFLITNTLYEIFRDEPILNTLNKVHDSFFSKVKLFQLLQDENHRNSRRN